MQKIPRDTHHIRIPRLYCNRGEAMNCCWRTIGLTAAAFGLGLLLASLLPPCILVPVSSILLVAVGVIIHFR